MLAVTCMQPALQLGLVRSFPRPWWVALRPATRLRSTQHSPPRALPPPPLQLDLTPENFKSFQRATPTSALWSLEETRALVAAVTRALERGATMGNVDWRRLAKRVARACNTGTRSPEVRLGSVRALTPRMSVRSGACADVCGPALAALAPGLRRSLRGAASSHGPGLQAAPQAELQRVQALRPCARCLHHNRCACCGGSGAWNSVARGGSVGVVAGGPWQRRPCDGRLSQQGSCAS